MSNVLRFPTKKSKSLFAYLVIYKERTFARVTLAGKFWPESEEGKAHRNLNTEIWRLRTMFRSSGLEPETFLHSDHDSIGFRRESDHWVDVAEFDALTQALSAHHTPPTRAVLLPTLAKAVTLYRGDLLEGLFDDWCLVQREAYRARLMAALEVLLATTMEAEHWQDAIGHGQRLLELDPLQEHVHRALMRCHVSLGNRPAALKQFAACERILRDELQIEPMDETRQLFETLNLAQRVSPPNAERPVTEPDHARARRVEVALASLSTARLWLEHASRQLQGEGDPK